MDDPKRLALGERQFFEFAFALIAFRLAVGRPGELVMGVDRRGGGPLALALIEARRAHELDGADREEKQKKTVSKGTDHDALPLTKWRHRTMRYAPSAIPFCLPASHEPKPLTGRNIFKHPTRSHSFHTGGIPSRVRFRPPL